MTFPLYYHRSTWVVCEEDGTIHSAHPSQFDAELCSHLTDWLRSL